MTDTPTLKIEGVRYIVTMDPERRIVADGSVVITGNRISRVGKSAELISTVADQTIDGSGMVLTPGFVNGHMHISYAHAARGLFPDDLGAEYLPNVFRLQQAMSADDEYATSMLAIVELLKYGTTTFIDPGTTTHLEHCMTAYDQAGCRIVIGRNVQDRPNPLNLPVYGTDEAIRETEDVVALAASRSGELITAWSMPFSAEFCTPELLEACNGIASDHATRSTLHFTNGPRWIEECRRAHGCTPTEYLDRHGVLNSRMTLAHSLGSARTRPA